MSSLSFPTDRQSLLIADASVVINLNATLRAAEVIRALPNPVAVTINSFSELRGGLSNGHKDAEQLQDLVARGIVNVVELGVVGAEIYGSLIEGFAARTLDDGEAATIGFAQQCGGVAVIDERKARSICLSSFPDLSVASTVDLLLHPEVEAALGHLGQREAIFNALRFARMRVPKEQIEKVVDLIGPEQAAICTSLPRVVRTVPSMLSTKTG